MFADMHCHDHMSTYLYLCQKKFKNGDKEISPWTIIATNMARLKYSDRAAGFGQGDLVALWNSGTRLVFVSMYPIEKDFFISPENTITFLLFFVKYYRGLLPTSFFRGNASV